MRSIRHRLTRQLVLGTLVIAGIGGTTAYLTMRAEMLRQFDQALLAKARAICALTKQENGKPPKFDSENLEALDFAGRGHVFHVRRMDGKTIVRSPDGDTPLPTPARAGRSPAFRNLTLPAGGAARAVEFVFTPPVEDEDHDDDRGERAPPHLATIFLAASRGSLDATLRTQLAALGLSSGLLVAGAWLLVPRVLRRGLQPLDQLGEQVTAINADSLANRFSESGTPAEIAPIVGRLNELLARLGDSFERERRFSADLAHELRTPLAELRSQAELALKWPDARAATADADTLEITLRMERLVTRLLALARAEGGHCGIVPTRLAPDAVVMAAWRPFAGPAARKGLTVDFNLPAGLTIDSDGALLREILTNLFSNAVAYTPAGGGIEITADVAAGPFTLRVANTVRDLATDDVTKLFDRFWRKDASRSDDAHAGLGLALARGYAHAIGWDLTAELRGTRLTFLLAAENG